MIDGRVYRAIQHGRTRAIEYRLPGFVREIYRGLDRATTKRFMNQLRDAGWNVEEQEL